MDTLNILGALGITEKQLKSIDSVAFDMYESLNTMFNQVSKVDTPQYFKDYYNALVRDFKTYTAGESFRRLAKLKGIGLTGIAADEEVVVAAIPKVKKSIAERIAEKKARKKGASPIIPPTVEAVPPAAEEPIEEPIEEPTVMPPVTTIDEGEVTETQGELFGFRITNTNNDGYIGTQAIGSFSTMLAYGGWDFNLLSFQNDSGNFFKLELYESLCKIVISTPKTFSDTSKSLVEVLNYGFGEKTSDRVTVDFIGANKDELMALKSFIRGKVFSDIKPIPSSELTAEKYTSLEYIEYNTDFSNMLVPFSNEGDDRTAYYTLAREIKLDWESKGDYLFKNDYDTQILTRYNILYGLLYSDYVYERAERLYKRKGSTVVVKKMTFFTPKGLRKSRAFIEIGTHIKEFSDYKAKDYTKNVEIGKRFQIASGNLDKAKVCRVVATKPYFEYRNDSEDDTTFNRDVKKENLDRDLYVADSEGNTYEISLRAYNYFKKYYNVVPTIKVSSTGDAVILYNAETIVGMIAAKKTFNDTILGVNNLEEFKTELRGIDSDTYDFMLSQTEEVAQEEAEEIEEEEAQIEGGGEDVDSDEGLKEELEERIEFLDELLQDAIEDNDDQSLVDELQGELETLRDLLEEL